jgi:hypothetical protein
VNAAFVMLTSAWMAGADPVPAAPAAPAAPVVSTSMGACNGGYGGYGCGSTAGDCGCEHQRQRLCDRLKGMFKRGNNCGCESAPTCAPAPVHHVAASCGCEDTCKKPGLCARLKGKFKRHNDCGCDTGCNSGCGGIGTYGGGIIGGTAEPIPAQPKPATGQPMPSKPTSTTPITMSGVITNVTPVGASASPF